MKYQQKDYKYQYTARKTQWESIMKGSGYNFHLLTTHDLAKQRKASQKKHPQNTKVWVSGVGTYLLSLI